MKKARVLVAFMFLGLSHLSFAQDATQENQGDIRKEALSDLKSDNHDSSTDADVLFVQKENLVEIKEKKRQLANNFPLVLQMKQYDKISDSLKNGADINLRIYEKNTATHISAMHGDVVFLEFLHKNKANLTLINNSNQNILHLATHNSSIEYLEKAKELMADKDFKNLITQKSKFGRTPLHELVVYARGAKENTIQTVEFLIKNGVNPNTTDDDGKTVLHYAISLENYAIIETLVKNGASFKVRDANNKTVQDFALEKFTLINTPKIYKLLDYEGKKWIEEKFKSTNMLHDLEKYGYTMPKEPEVLAEKPKKESKSKNILRPSKLN